jgi:hypothetical protein
MDGGKEGEGERERKKMLRKEGKNVKKGREGKEAKEV